MTCQELDARVDEWLEGTLPPDEVERLEAHLATCERCHEATRKLRHLLAHAAALARLRAEMDRTLKAQGDPRALGTGDIFESYPRHSPMRPELGGFAERGAYNPAFQKK